MINKNFVLNFCKTTVYVLLILFLILLFQPNLYNSLFLENRSNIEYKNLTLDTYEDILNSECKYSINEAEFMIKNSEFNGNSELRILSTDAVEFTYTKFSCFNKISYSDVVTDSEVEGKLIYYAQPFPRRTIVFIIYSLLIVGAILSDKFKAPFGQTKDVFYNLSILKKVSIGLSVLFLILTSFMFFYNKIPQIDSNVAYLSSNYLTIAKPKQLFTDPLTVPLFDNKCKYSPENAIKALERNGFTKSNIKIKAYQEKGILNPKAISYLDFKCWDRIVGSTYSQGTKLKNNDQINLYYNPYPKGLIWIISFLVLFLSFRIKDVLYKSESKFRTPQYIPNFLINNFHIFLLIVTLYQFFTFNFYIQEYYLAFENNILNLLTIFFVPFITYKIISSKKDKKYLLLVSIILVVSSYSYLFSKGLSINEIFTDVDVYQSQLPISILQFEQAKDYGEIFTWNSNLGSGYQLAGQYASDSLIRQLIFQISPNFNFATNLYFLLHVTLGMFFIALFMREIGFSYYSSVIGAFVFFTSNQIITWITFLHYPAFILSFSMIMYALIISKKNYKLSSLLIILSFYISATGAHLQNLVFLFIYLIGFLILAYFFKELRDKISYKFISFSILISGILSLYLIMPFFELLNNLGDRVGSDNAKYFIADDLVNFVNNRILLDSGNVISNYSINTQLFISTIIVFIFLSLKTKNKTIEKFSIYSFIAIYFFSTNNPLQNFIVENVPGLSLVSNWQRTAPFLIFSVVLYLISKLDEFVLIQDKKSVFFVILFSIIFSSITRINAFYNIDINELRSSYLYSHTEQLRDFSKNFNLPGENSRIMSVCNFNVHLHITPDSNLIVNNDLFWTGLYESFPNINYTSKFKTISETPPGIAGGRYYTHVRGDEFYPENLDNLNVEFIVARKEGCEFDKNNFIKLKDFDNYEIYQKLSYVPIINLGIKNDEYLIPDEINRKNPELIEINIKNFEEDGYLYFNEIYSAYWNVYINSKKAELINNDGFMSVKINKGDSQVIFIFDNRDLNQNIKSLNKFLTND